MGEARFGTAEKLHCIQDVALKGASGEDLCLAYKTSTLFVLGGVYVRDDGYILKVQTQDIYYPLPEGEELADFQASELLPKVLPAYHLALTDYLAGYSLWLIIGTFALLNALSSVGRRVFQRMRPQAAGEFSLFGPPVLRTHTDRFVFEQARKMLASNEVVQHQAYTLDRSLDSAAGALSASAFFAVLTNQRLLLIRTRVGALAPLCENHGVEAIALTDITDCERDGDTLTLTLANGSQRTLHVEDTRHLANQAAFAHCAPRLLVAHLPQHAAPFAEAVTSDS
jgi:hypothetical protein